MNNKHIIFLIGCAILLLPSLIYAQYVLPDFQSQTLHRDSLLVRWEPRTLEEWRFAREKGYVVEVYEGDNPEEMQLTETDTVRTASTEEWEAAILRLESDTLLRDNYAGAKDLLFPEEGDKDQWYGLLAREEGKSLTQTVDEFYMGYLIYAVTYDFKMIEMAGLGYKIPIDNGKYYKLKAYVENYEPFIFEFGSKTSRKERIPELSSEFGDLKVDLRWNTREYRNDYFGYYLEISDNAKDYVPINDAPYVNVLDTIADNPDAHFLNQEIALTQNYKDYWYRIKGMNYFGITSKKSSVTRGFGFEQIPAMPMIHYADQTEDNEAFIKWNLDDKHNRLIDRFTLYRADSLKGKFTVYLDSIPVDSRSVKAAMVETRNFFSIAITPKNGEPIKSFPVLVMGQDTIPPASPLYFDGEIDSLGIVTLLWSPNEEDDLEGYKVFRSEYIEDEFALITAASLTDTVFTDTVNLNSTNEEIHYKILAADKRNNRSPFTKILTLVRPDTIPPTPPLVREVSFKKDSILIEWAPSSSQDAVLHQVFKKEISEEGWELFAEVDTIVTGINFFVDTMFAYDKIYAYTVMAKDDDDLISLPSKPFMVQTKSYKLKEAFKSFEVIYDEDEQMSVIKWELKEENTLEEIIVYRGESKETISMLKIINPAEVSEIVQPTKKEEEWFFLFSPVYKDGSASKMSKIVEVRPPDTE